NPSLVISPTLYKKLNYRPIEDFAYVGRYGSVANVLVVNPSLPVKTAQELFKAMTGTYIVHIPFRGAGPAVAALLGGEIEMMIDNIPPQVPQIKSGKVRALAVTSLQRSKALPDVPTMDEVGLKGYEVVSFFGLAARAGTPRETVLRLNAALNKSTQDPKLREILESRGSVVVQGTPEDFLNFIKAETAKFAPVIKRAGVVVE